VTGSGGEPQARVLDLLRRRGQTLAVAESLTGGMLAARLVDVPGASAAFRGGVVAYATDLKHRLLGVDPDLLDRCGPVDADVAGALADGVRDRLGADWGAATTGVAGPEPQGGRVPGTVYVAVSGPPGRWVVHRDLPGSRSEVRAATVTEVLHLLLFALGEREP
jgi:nicotinamide-nucleotide amidase